MDVDQELSPSLPEQAVFVGVLLKSFPQGSIALEKLIDLTFGRKRLERLTERIGAERVVARDLDRERVAGLTLMEKIHGPAGVAPPEACAVMADGGRHQRVAPNPDSKTHWFEDQAGICLTLGNLHSADDTTLPDGDPCPNVPSFPRNFEQVVLQRTFPISGPLSPVFGGEG